MSEREEVLLEPGYVLHQRAYRNTSLIIDCLTPRHGRQSLIANGARRPGNRQLSLLQPFQTLRFSWIRRGELGKLIHVEADAAASALTGQSLLAGFYLNELLMRLVPRGDQNDALFSCYSNCLDQLVTSAQAARAVRIFEYELIDALGYGLDLTHDFRTGEPLSPDKYYWFEHEGGVTAANGTSGMESFSGKDLISLREHALDDTRSLAVAKQLLGTILQQHLGSRPLKTREVMREIVKRRLAQ